MKEQRVYFSSESEGTVCQEGEDSPVQAAPRWQPQDDGSPKMAGVSVQLGPFPSHLGETGCRQQTGSVAGS